jgi:hypothetical protein
MSESTRRLDCALRRLAVALEYHCTTGERSVFNYYMKEFWTTLNEVSADTPNPSFAVAVFGTVWRNVPVQGVSGTEDMGKVVLLAVPMRSNPYFTIDKLIGGERRLGKIVAIRREPVPAPVWDGVAVQSFCTGSRLMCDVMLCSSVE